MKQFFLGLLGRANKGDVPSRVAPAILIAQPKPRPGVGVAKVATLRQPARPVASAQPQVFRQLADLPEWTVVESCSGGKFEIPEQGRDVACVVKLAEGEEAYAVLVTKDVFSGAMHLGLLERIKKSGATVALSGIADGPLVSRIHKDDVSASGLAEQDQKPIMREIDALASAALESSGSDIHIEKRQGAVFVKMRVNGRLEMYTDSWAPEYVMKVARTLHTIADEDSKDTSFNPEGQMSVSRTLMPSGLRVKLRVQMSTAYPDEGLDIVIRVLKVAVAAKVKSIPELGYAPDHVSMLEYMLSSPDGLIIVSGTTGSGKTTTLQTAISNIRNSDAGLKIITIEDPPEYVLDGVTQIPVVRRRGGSKSDENPFTNAMRSTMRMDPDVIMVGEIRDQETAALAVSMVQSGHKVLSTIHTESALGGVGRLRSMGVELDVLGARRFISGLIFQTLVPTLCEHCKVDYEPTLTTISAALHERLSHVYKPGDTIFLEALNTAEMPNKCRHCRGTGISGRTVCAEMVIPDSTILECIRAGDMTRAYSHWRSLRTGKPLASMIGATALEHGLLKMRRGEVSPADIERALGLLHDFSLETNITGMETDNLLGLG